VKKRRVIAALLLFFVLSKVATAFVGVPLLFAAPVFEAAGTTFATWAALAAGVGATLFSVKLQDDSGNEFLRVRLNPNSPAYVPSGWTGGAHAYDDAVPPGTSGAVTVYGIPYFGTTGFATAQLAADDGCAKINQSFGPGTCDSGSPSYSVNGSAGCSVGNPCFTFCQTYQGNQTCDHVYTPMSTSQVCPAGYSVSGAACTLTTPAAVPYPPDSRCGLKFSAGVMSYDSRDPDCASPGGTSPSVGQVNLSSDGKTLNVTNTAGTQRVQVAVQTDGSVKITTWTPSSTDPTTTSIQTATVSNPASTPTVTTTQQATTNSVGTPAFTQTPTPTTSNDKPITFPDDYSREATQISVLGKVTAIDSKLADIKTQLTTDGHSPDDPVAKTQTDIEGVFFSDTFTALKAWQLPARSASCPTMTISFLGNSYTMNSHCPILESNRAVLSAVMLVCYTVIALFNFLTPKDYNQFFQKLRENDLDGFRSKLEVALSKVKGS